MDIIYNKIGIDYNLSRKADKYLTERLLYFLNPKKEGFYLDIGCGTGNYTNEFQKKGFNFIGIDPSEEMLNKAKQKNKNIDWQLGSAEKTNLESESIDGIIATLTIHHWQNLAQSFKELFRVLKNGKKIIIFTSTPPQMKGYWLNHYFPETLIYSINQMPSYEKTETALKQAGFKLKKTEKYFVKPDLQDLFLYSGKHNPKLYFNPQIRKGISSFSLCVNKNEVTEGLKKLKADIESGKINEVMKSYENDFGDYLFIESEKKFQIMN